MINAIANESLAILVATTINCSGSSTPPHITINPYSDDIVYEYAYTSAQLGQKETDTISPYGVNVDTATGGLREDRPEISMEVHWKTMTFRNGSSCIWYDNIKVNIHLQPKIYIAKEFQYSPCKEAIMKHELKHVQVDRDVMNKYAKLIGKSVQTAVNGFDEKGPYKAYQLQDAQEKMANQVREAVMAYQQPLNEEMHRLQSKVDSLQEYQAVNPYCEKVMQSLQRYKR